MAKNWMSVIVALVVVGCDVEPEADTFAEREVADLERVGPFVDEVIRTFGTNGEMCSQDAAGRTTCLSKSATRPVPLRLGDDPSGALYLCTRQSNGTLGGCVPTSPAHTCADGVCWCNTDQDCLDLAANNVCKGDVGECGNCDRGNCCCYPGSGS